MHAKVAVSNLKLIGNASCMGGKFPDPPLSGFSLLAWSVWHESTATRYSPRTARRPSRISRSRRARRRTTRRSRPDSAPRSSTSPKRSSTPSGPSSWGHELKCLLHNRMRSPAP